MSPREALAKRVVASPAPVLAPLTRAGTAPFRALCRRHGADATMGEMIFARQLCKGDRREQARLRRPEAETLFGAQIATNQISEGVAACVLAEEAGAAWVDLNCGCPILRENQSSGAPRDLVPVTASPTPPTRRCPVPRLLDGVKVDENLTHWLISTQARSTKPPAEAWARRC